MLSVILFNELLGNKNVSVKNKNRQIIVAHEADTYFFCKKQN